MNIFLRDHVSMPVYRGNLTMPPGATPAQHVATRKAFLRSMNRWKRKHGYTFEMLGILDFADHHQDARDPDAHWDIVAYSDAPPSALRKAMSAWRRAGGKRHSLPDLDPDRIKGMCRYAAKDVDPIRRPRHHLASKAVNRVWYTAGFWAGHKPADLWQDVIAEWRAAGVFGDVASNTEDTSLEPSDAHQEAHQDHHQGGRSEAHQDADKGGVVGSKTISSVLDDLTRERAARDAVLAEIDARLAALPRRDHANIRHLLPTTRDDAVMAERLATISGQTVDMVEDFIASRPFGLVETMRPRGRHADPVYHLPPRPPSPCL
jgi:hypothetical protein